MTWRARRALLGALLLTSGLAGCGRAPHRAVSGILLVVLDTVRADHLGCYGSSRPTSPNLDRLASEGERYDSAFAQAPWTLPAVASILTGQAPHVHGAGGRLGELRAIRRDLPTLAERVSQAGYATAGFVNVVFLDPGSGLGRGFDRYDLKRSRFVNKAERNAAETTDAALAWLQGVKERPYFLFVHYFDAHQTYDPPPPYDQMFEPDERRELEPGWGMPAQIFGVRKGTLTLTPRQKESLVARYDGEIRFVDEQFGRLRHGMEDLGLWPRSLVIVVADHGEEFWDHGSIEHGHTHYRELLQIPLIVRRPNGLSGAVRKERVRQIDIVPTVLEAAGLPADGDLPGHVLGRGRSDVSVAEGTLWAGDLASVRSDLATLILDRTDGRRWLFAPEDPLERHDLDGLRPELESSLESILRALPPTRTDSQEVWQPSPEQLEQLRSLGYVR